MTVAKLIELLNAVADKNLPVCKLEENWDITEIKEVSYDFTDDTDKILLE